MRPRCPQKLLHVEEVLPVHAGPLTLYYPKWIPGEHGPDGPVSDLTGLKFEADGKPVAWKRDLLDVYTFHLDVPEGAIKAARVLRLHRGCGFSATDKLLVLEWNEVVLYPAGITSDKLTFDAKLKMPERLEVRHAAAGGRPGRRRGDVQAHLARASGGFAGDHGRVLSRRST